MSYLHYLCLLAYSGVVLCFRFVCPRLVCPLLPVSLDSLSFTDPSVFLTFIYQPDKSMVFI